MATHTDGAAAPAAHLHTELAELRALDDADARLLGLWVQSNALLAEWDRRDHAFLDAPAAEKDAAYDHLNETIDEWHAVAAEIARTPVATSAGAAIQMRIALAESGYRADREPAAPWPADDDGELTAAAAMRSVLRVLEGRHG